jgi:hopanoid biosynthesis associated protein HpnK
MVTGTAADEAVLIAKDDPEMGVGLHLTLSDGSAALPRQMIPNLVNKRSAFARRPELAALNYFFNSAVRRQLRFEIEAQFVAFEKTGLPPSHVDGHQHMHGHPVVAQTVVELALKYGAYGVRVPNDPFRVNIQADRSHLLSKVCFSLANRYLARNLHRHLTGSGLTWCDVTIGSHMSGKMTADYIIKMLDSINCNSIEVYLHPLDKDERAISGGPNPDDLKALLSPDLKHFIEEKDYELIDYAELRGINR